MESNYSSKQEVSEVVEQALLPLGFTIKPTQLEAILNIVNNIDTLCVLPTSFGKSLIYQLLPTVFRCVKSTDFSTPLIIVVSPLVSLIENQIEEANNCKLGLNACKLDVKILKEIKQFKYNVLIGTPESWLNNPVWRELLSSDLFSLVV